MSLPISAKISAFGSYIAGGIFIVMGLFNILHKDKAVKAFIVSIIDILLLSLSVSIDSIMVGLSLGFPELTIFSSVPRFSGYRRSDIVSFHQNGPLLS